jgi:aryl-alcohol dehydrogenase-like predicted oxidoreductase
VSSRVLVPVVAVALSGTRRPQEIEENVRALDALPKLTPEVLARIDAITANAAGQTDVLPT